MGRDVTLARLVARVFFPCMKGEVAGYVEACRTCQTKLGKGADQRHTLFPCMKGEVAGYIEACRTCQTKLGKGADQRHTLRSVPSGYPFQRIHIDLVGPLNKGARTGASNILTVRDSFTKWVEAIPMAATTTLEVARALEREIFARYGYPETIHSDRGPQFTSQFFLDLGKTLGIQITDTTGYNPKGNGQVERMHRDLGAIMRAALRDDPNASWEDVLPQALFALRTAVCRSTGLAPYQLLFGRDCSTPIDLLFGRPEEDDIDKGGRQHHDYLRRLRKRIDAAQTYARRNMAEAVVRQRRQYHQERKSFRPGVRVWLLTPSVKPGTARKLANPWSGPLVVCLDGVNDVMVRIRPLPEWSSDQNTRVVSIDRLKLYGSEAKARPPADDADLDMAGDEYVEHVHNRPPSPPPAPPFMGGGGGGGGGGPAAPGGGGGGPAAPGGGGGGAPPAPPQPLPPPPPPPPGGGPPPGAGPRGAGARPLPPGGLGARPRDPPPLPPGGRAEGPGRPRHRGAGELFPDPSDDEDMPEEPRRRPLPRHPTLRLLMGNRLEPRAQQEARIRREQEEQEARRRAEQEADRGLRAERREQQRLHERRELEERAERRAAAQPRELEDRAERQAAERREQQRQQDHDRRQEDRRRLDEHRRQRDAAKDGATAATRRRTAARGTAPRGGATARREEKTSAPPAAPQHQQQQRRRPSTAKKRQKGITTTAAAASATATGTTTTAATATT